MVLRGETAVKRPQILLAVSDPKIELKRLLSRCSATHPDCRSDIRRARRTQALIHVRHGPWMLFSPKLSRKPCTVPVDTHASAAVPCGAAAAAVQSYSRAPPGNFMLADLGEPGCVGKLSARRLQRCQNPTTAKKVVYSGFARPRLTLYCRP